MNTREFGSVSLEPLLKKVKPLFKNKEYSVHLK